MFIILSTAIFPTSVQNFFFVLLQDLFCTASKAVIFISFKGSEKLALTLMKLSSLSSMSIIYSS
jgi:hypothetical protein